MKFAVRLLSCLHFYEFYTGKSSAQDVSAKAAIVILLTAASLELRLEGFHSLIIGILILMLLQQYGPCLNPLY